MKSMAAVFIVAVVAFLTYQLGVLERPSFIYRDKFLGGHELFAIMATTRERNIGQHVARLVGGSKKGVEEGLQDGGTMMKAAAKIYGLDGAPAIGTGVWYDDPSEAENPRWAIGWAVEGPYSLDELAAMLPAIQKASGLAEPMKVIRIGGVGTETFTARIPWRNALTPVIAAMIHWGRGFQIYKDYMEDHKEADKGVPPVALEVYACGENDTKEFIDYVVLFGDVANTWEDGFPGSLGEKEPTTEETMEETAEIPEAVDTAAE